MYVLQYWFPNSENEGGDMNKINKRWTNFINMRGGSIYNEYVLKMPYRMNTNSTCKTNNVGFRIVRTI